MKSQILVVALFALNLLAVWSTLWLNRCHWYRLIGYLVMALLPLLSVLPNQPHFELDYYWWKIAGVAAIILGASVLILAIREFSKQKGALFTTGPYKFVRHPQYLGLILIWVGWWWLWAAVYGFYFGMFILALTWLQGYLEEKLVLEKQFGEAYRAYKQKTGMFWIK
jgi:protein-S-isoprenylcysteine O-methyltransferase Ste14